MQNHFSLMNVLEGYVRNYRHLNIHESHNWSTITSREIGYFSKVGEYLGLFPFMEDTKPNLDYGRSRPMDLSWWLWDQRLDKEHFVQLILHLERENQTSKANDTIDKLFCKTKERYVPNFVIGIQNVESKDAIESLQKEILRRNKDQNSEVLMIYQFLDNEIGVYRLQAHYSSSDGTLVDNRNLISELDNTKYWMMCFEEEYHREQKMPSPILSV